jgi:hypothetical protein
MLFVHCAASTTAETHPPKTNEQTYLAKILLEPALPESCQWVCLWGEAEIPDAIKGTDVP